MQFYIMTLHVGITGSIGSGKSTVCHLFEILGIPVYYADVRAKEILHSNLLVKKAVENLLGMDVYSSNGILDRKKVASIVFSNPETLAKYNAIVHPAVLQDSNKWMQQLTNVPYTLKEAALLFESGSYLFLDKIICVTAPESLRIERVQNRDNVSADEVRIRIQNQWAEESKSAKSDFIIINDGGHLLIPQVMAIHQTLIEFSSQ